MKMLSLSSFAAYMHSASFVRIRRKLIVRKTNDTFECMQVAKFAVNLWGVANQLCTFILCEFPLSSNSLNSSLFYCRSIHCSCLLTCRQEMCANAKCGRPFGKTFESRACRQHTLKYGTVTICKHWWTVKNGCSEKTTEIFVQEQLKKKHNRKQSQPESLYVYMFWYLNKAVEISLIHSGVQWRRLTRDTFKCVKSTGYEQFQRMIVSSPHEIANRHCSSWFLFLCAPYMRVIYHKSNRIFHSFTSPFLFGFDELKIKLLWVLSVQFQAHEKKKNATSNLKRSVYFSVFSTE